MKRLNTTYLVAGLMGKPLSAVLVSNLFIYVIVGVGYYSEHKQSKVPVFEITEDTLVINHFGHKNRQILLDSILEVKKSFLLGYLLVTISGDVQIPLRSLSKKDRGLFLSELNREKL